MMDEQERRTIEQVIAAGSPQDIGWFRFWFGDNRWEWSPEVAHMHGYEADEVTPTTELLLSHKHPEDRERVEADLVTSVRDHAPFSSRHRIVDTAGKTHHVIVVSDAVTDEKNEVIGTAGYYIDLTDIVAEQRNEVLDELLPEMIEHRAQIEQAKGLLMMTYGINAEQAFRVLVWRSQETNMKLRVLAERIIARLDELPPAAPALRTRFDHLLLTVHQDTPPT
ncbi:PAS and ANTAR domain-containing protein [Nocardia sp. NBC_01503]|uniref:PAS and ANTAR domain-containing protein n=1 Tax=Nocardia sp. NBC_01503 TaxID=2975997 RepID=UPI002E7C177C|nr:PAS and ANTAR domain-containing protein [Nocardia sp. NBC_01503]WTL30557.1 PAS and ANTAR domain-containing protein [Nocardia sp. NBC_01503]